MFIFVKKERFWNGKVTPPSNLLPRGREEFLGPGKMHQGKVLVSMAEYFLLCKVWGSKTYEKVILF